MAVVPMAVVPRAVVPRAVAVILGFREFSCVLNLGIWFGTYLWRQKM
jgi:hypothetical protein